MLISNWGEVQALDSCKMDLAPNLKAIQKMSTFWFTALPEMVILPVQLALYNVKYQIEGGLSFNTGSLYQSLYLMFAFPKIAKLILFSA